MPEDLQPVETTEEIAAPAEAEQPVESASAPDETAPIPEVAKPDRAEKRIARLTWEAAEARRETERLRVELEQKKAEEARTVKPNTEGKPKEDDFATASEFVEALADWKYEQRSKTERETRQAEEAKQSQSSLQKKVQADIAAFRAVQPDFDEVMEDAAFQSTPLMIQELQESDMGPALLYHFAKNPDEANRIAEMTDSRKVAREVAKIEARLTSAPAKKQAPITPTPAPIKPVAASRQAIANLGKIDDDAEYFRQRRALTTR
jgi:hypothetical protein